MMAILVDTNVLLRMVQSGHAHRPVALAALSKCRSAGHRLMIVPQNIYEFWVVVTRPIEQNGLGMTASVAYERTSELLDLFTLLRDERTIFEHWHELVRTYEVNGKSAHDARLVASMKRHKLGHVLTFNATDFARYTEVTALTPGGVAEGRVSV